MKGRRGSGRRVRRMCSLARGQLVNLSQKLVLVFVGDAS